MNTTSPMSITKLKALARRKRYPLRYIVEHAGKRIEELTRTEYQHVMLALFTAPTRRPCGHCRRLPTLR